jgi:ribose-phosphate pyrophosphokinase
LELPLGEAETHIFSEGNTFVKIHENVRGCNVFMIQSLYGRVNDALMELLFFIDAARRASAESVTAVIPFHSYAKADKKEEPRVSIRARVVADLIEAAGADRVVSMDLHSPCNQGFFNVPVDHLYALFTLCKAWEREDLGDLVVVSPDMGFAKMARRFANQLGASMAIGDKDRPQHDEAAVVMELVGDVKGKNALIVDDMVISGGSLCEMASVLKEKGAKQIFAAVTHGILTAGSQDRIEKSAIEELVMTDTVPPPEDVTCTKFRWVSVAPTFALAIHNIHERTSISGLFDGCP